MTADPNDMVRVASGTLIQIHRWRDLLHSAGIESRVVGDHLTAGLGTGIPGTVELWVHRGDTEAAEGAFTSQDGQHRRESELKHGHPESDPKPDRPRGPQHGAPPHRPLPS